MLRICSSSLPSATRYKQTVYGSKKSSWVVILDVFFDVAASVCAFAAVLPTVCWHVGSSFHQVRDIVSDSELQVGVWRERFFSLVLTISAIWRERGISRFLYDCTVSLVAHWDTWNWAIIKNIFTPVLFLPWQVKMSAVREAYFFMLS